MKIAVADLQPNPFRNLKNYPIDEAKVEALVRSIKDTTFWDNLLARKAPNGSDGFEIAYGHHRLKALKKARVDEIDIPVRKLDNTLMAQIMAHENLEEWSHSASIEQETVRSIIEAYGKGEINLPKPSKTANRMRFAPSFVVAEGSPSGENLYPYTLETLADFLGWKHYKVETAINALALIESSVAKPETFQGLSTRQAKEVAEQATRILRQTNDPSRAKAVASGLASGFRQATGAKKTSSDSPRRTKDVTIHSARTRADEMAGTKLAAYKAKKLPNFDQFVESFAGATGWYFENKRHQWNAIVQHKEDMPAVAKRKLIAALQRLINEAQKYIDKLEG